MEDAAHAVEIHNEGAARVRSKHLHRDPRGWHRRQ
jgi:hypothetical protein